MILRKHLYQGDQGLLDDVIGIQRWEALAHERLHHGTVARNELPPARVQGILREVAKKRLVRLVRGG